jgi:hypothetical protein
LHRFTAIQTPVIDAQIAELAFEGRTPVLVAGLQLAAACEIAHQLVIHDLGGDVASININLYAFSPSQVDQSELAAWTLVTSTILNMDEAITKN